MSEKIVNVYKFKLGENLDSYIYSLRKENDFLGFDYYVLSTNKENKPTIYEANNTIKLLHSNNVNILPIEKNKEEYKRFLETLSQAINNKKEEKLVRK